MAITLADFTKIWASTSPLTPYTFSDPNYAEGWNFIGGTPPARQMWDSIQKQNDEKMKYIVDNFLPVVGDPLTLTADDGNGNSADLVLNSNGSATWNSNELETVVSVDIDDDMGSTPATAHIKYESGLLICFGNVGNVTTSGTWVTFDSAFSTKPRVLAGCYSNSIHVGWAGTSTTGVTLNTTSGSGVSVGYIAIGTWK